MTSNPKKSLAQGDYLLIAANSGRMLAKAARNAGYLPLVIDLCADSDTYHYAAEIIRLPEFCRKHLIAQVNNLKSRYQVAYAIYGSGFEIFEEGLALLAENFTLLGNSAEVFALLSDKVRFFDNLKRLTIPFPVTQFKFPAENPQYYLFKPEYGYGGVGIVKADIVKPNGYWQKYQTGAPHSALFLADGKRGRIIGFNEQWTTALDNQPCVFSGIINATKLTVLQKNQLSVWVNKIVEEYGLVGLNSLDFIQDGDDLYLLEINPRPPASMTLYDADLLTLHIRACQQRLTKDNFTQNGVTGYQILYAPQSCRVPEALNWPEGAMDLPVPGSEINTHRPICSMIAHGASAEIVRNALNAKQAYILNQLPELTHGLHRQC